MDPRAFTKQWQSNAAMNAAVPPLMDTYCLRETVTSDGHKIGAPDLLDISPNGQQRDAILGARPIDGAGLVNPRHIRH